MFKNNWGRINIPINRQFYVFSYYISLFPRQHFFRRGLSWYRLTLSARNNNVSHHQSFWVIYDTLYYNIWSFVHCNSNSMLSLLLVAECAMESQSSWWTSCIQQTSTFASLHFSKKRCTLTAPFLAFFKKEIDPDGTLIFPIFYLKRF